MQIVFAYINQRTAWQCSVLHLEAEADMICALCCRAAALCAAEHDLDTTRLHTLDADQFWQAFERRYGANPQLVGCCYKQR
jgi:hypothetical protein